MDITSIVETIIGSFLGAFSAYISGIGVYKFNLNRSRKQELKRYFGLLDSNHKAIDELGRLFNSALSQNNIIPSVLMVKKANEPKYKLHNVKKHALKLTLEIKEFCKEDELWEFILRQIDFQDRVYGMLCSLNILNEEDLEKKFTDSSSDLKHIIHEMGENHNNWIFIQSKLKKLKLL